MKGKERLKVRWLPRSRESPVISSAMTSSWAEPSFETNRSKLAGIGS
ncbi:MAG: hypothetical protein JRN52_07335 [Nitrososphaerota archaeon]|nr:hypothetical protein [Nitrososphaerota archaeon]